MKKALLVLMLIAPIITKAQDFSAVWKKAEKLKADSNIKGAIAVWDSEIERVLAGEVVYRDFLWQGLLVNASRFYHADPNKYDNLLYGTKAEKFKDKIDFLTDAGVKYLISYEFDDRTIGTFRFHYNSCTSKQNRTLIWVMNGHLYVQGFDDCNTYKPLKIENTEMVDLLTNHYNVMADDSLKLPVYMPKKTKDYHFQFYIGTDTLKKNPLSLYYLKSEDNDDPDWPVKKASDLSAAELLVYNRNNNSYLGRLLLGIVEIDKKYKTFIDSPAERAKVGKIE